MCLVDMCDCPVHAGCGKPAFFNSRKPMFEVHTSSGMLRNTDSGNPMVPIGQPPTDASSPSSAYHPSMNAKLLLRQCAHHTELGLAGAVFLALGFSSVCFQVISNGDWTHNLHLLLSCCVVSSLLPALSCCEVHLVLGLEKHLDAQDCYPGQSVTPDRHRSRQAVTLHHIKAVG